MRPGPLAALLFLLGTTGLVRAQTPAATLPPPRLTGTILDTAMRPVPDVNFMLLGLGEVKTDSTGSFRFVGVPAGSLIFRVTRIGYTPLMKMLEIRDGDSLHLDIILRPATQELEPIEVHADRYSAENDRTGFERRRSSGFGRYLSTEQILSSHTHDTGTLLRTLGGLAVDANNRVYLDHGVTTLIGTPCKGVQVLINGVRMGDDFDIRTIPVETVRGVELYSGPATTPVEFRTSRVTCGTLLVWTW